MILNELFNRSPNFPLDTSVRDVVRNYHDGSNLKNYYLNDAMKKLGWEMTNYGFYSWVFEKVGERYVIKLNRKRDDAFAWFAYITIKYPNHHFPVIANARLLNIGGGKYYMFAIEKLQNSTYGSEISQFCRDVMRCHNREAINDAAREFGFWKLPEYKYQKDSLINALICLKRVKPSDFSFDISHSNIMQRPDNTIIISDPVVR